MTLVSVVIPTLNNEETLSKCLESIRSCSYDNLEIIIVDGHSEDCTRKIAREYGCDILLDDGDTINSARNVGIEAASGELIAFTDADCVVPTDWVQNLLDPFDDNVASVGGPNITPPDDSKFAKAVGDVLTLLSSPGSRYGYKGDEVEETFHNPGCNVAYRTGVLKEVGGFDPQLETAGDEEIDYRIRQRGYGILFTPHASVLHYRRPSIKSFARMAYRYGFGRAQAIRKHTGMAEWFHFLPSLLLASFLAKTIQSGKNSILAYSVGDIVSTFSLGLHLSTKTSIDRLPTYILLFHLWFFGWAIGFAQGLIDQS